MGPGDNKLAMNIYISRQEKATLKAEAARRKVTMMDVIRIGLDHVAALRTKAGLPLPRPVAINRAPWRERRRKERAKRAA